MSDDKAGFNLSIGGDVKGDVAQTIDKSQHQTTNIAGDMHGDVNNTQGGEDPTWDMVIAESEDPKAAQALSDLSAAEESGETVDSDAVGRNAAKVGKKALKMALVIASKVAPPPAGIVAAGIAAIV